MLRAVLLAVVALGACATTSTPDALRITASHYASMTGVTVQSGIGPMTCARDTITGSHVLHWYCRFEKDSMQYQLSAPIAFVVR